MSKKLGHYEILGEIGKGANAVVYKAKDTQLERVVALKVIRPQLLWEQEAVERFMREAKAAAQLEHPNIVTIYEIGEEQGTYFIAMQYISGRTVKEIIAQKGPFAPEHALTILRQIADALDYAHKQGFIHRDVKPSNILVTEDDRAYLTDFGLVKGLAWASLTTSGGVIGTPHYTSPEIAEGEEVDWRADLYSLGVVLYEMLTGKVPFDAPTPMAVLRAHTDKQPPKPRDLNLALSGAVEAVLLKALAKKREERFQSGAEMMGALEEAVQGEELRRELEGRLTGIERERMEIVEGLEGVLTGIGRKWMEIAEGIERKRMEIVEGLEGVLTGIGRKWMEIAEGLEEVKGALVEFVKAYCGECDEETTWAVRSNGLRCLGCGTFCEVRDFRETIVAYCGVCVGETTWAVGSNGLCCLECGTFLPSTWTARR
jgi:tRNA A-37 threonylcarbamoyl transferase component Bud32